MNQLITASRKNQQCASGYLVINKDFGYCLVLCKNCAAEHMQAVGNETSSKMTANMFANSITIACHACGAHVETSL